jgi:hypothetical protein
MKTKYPTTVSELPEGVIYAILHPESMTIPGDERSRTNPGHGYPEHSVDYWKIETFRDRAEWEAEITRLSQSTGYYRREFKAVVMNPVTVKTTISIAVNLEVPDPPRGD